MRKCTFTQILREREEGGGVSDEDRKSKGRYNKKFPSGEKGKDYKDESDEIEVEFHYISGN